MSADIFLTKWRCVCSNGHSELMATGMVLLSEPHLTVCLSFCRVRLSSASIAVYCAPTGERGGERGRRERGKEGGGKERGRRERKGGRREE